MVFLDFDSDLFLSDFGCDVVGDAISCRGILDEPGAVIMNGQIITTDYKLMLKASDAALLEYGDTLTVDGREFYVETISAIDKQFSEVALGIGGLSQVPNSSYILFTQAIASATWTITHSLNYFPRVRLFDDAGDEFDDLHRPDAGRSP